MKSFVEHGILNRQSISMDMNREQNPVDLAITTDK